MASKGASVPSSGCRDLRAAGGLTPRARKAGATAKRDSGESSVSKGEDGRWHGYVSMGRKEGGKRDRRHVAAGSRAEVLRLVRELEDQRDQGVVLAEGRGLTVEQWLTLWIDTIAVRRVRPSTLAGYRSCLVRINLHLGHHRLDRLQPEQLEAFYQRLEDDGLSSTTAPLHHRVLSRALKVAMQRGRLVRNVATLVDPPTARRDEVEPLTNAEARRLLDAAEDLPNGARWSVALALGLRQGEALGLLWDAVDLEAGTLTVRWALQRQKGKGLVLVLPKSKAGRRTIKLPEQMREALRRHRVRQNEQRLAAADVWEDGGFVFCQGNGRPIDARRDWLDWKALLEAAGVRDARLHDARHTAATMLLQQGVPARVAMQILGHSHIALTLGTYSHVVPEIAEEAAERIQRALWD
ncbi:MAG: integrase family protein [Frankiales bacterium]|nr:integrase family protein [Frankiales bacterium]